ncbi:MAG TPA: methyltransferase domain-containing protein [Candidatus Acidoferrales bacterium]|nr:methyltransferase domain-containing protein [Candidatus Acidoferrales bacterium]
MQSPAEVYERYLVPGILAPWTAELLALAAPRPGERLLDLACGTGLVARAAAPDVGFGGKIVGLDINPGMLAVGRAVASEKGLAIEWLRGDAVALPLKPASFNAVLCQQGFQFFPERRAAATEAYRVLLPGGRLALAVWRPIQFNPGQLALAGALARHVSAKAAERVRVAFSLGEPDELRGILAGAGFREVATQSGTKNAHFKSPREFVRMVVTSAFAGTDIRVSEDTLSAVVRDVGAALRSYADRRGLSFPMEALLALARK